VIAIILLFFIGCAATPDNSINNQPPKGSVIEKAPRNSK
jgi:hypothetical protein